MLKVQLRSKLSQLGTDWATVEDVLTGDFFGVLDYLPREPYLCEFLRAVSKLNGCEDRLVLNQVDWQEAHLLFWRQYQVDDERTEPDVVMVSNRWVLVVEIKLGSGLGRNQPWREYQVGQQIARDNNLPGDAVHYMIVSRDRVEPAKAFCGCDTEKRAELSERTLFLRWSQAVTIVEEWLRNGAGRRRVEQSELRMLADLHAVLRRRRILAFRDFAFPHQQPVTSPLEVMFCPPRFQGFLNQLSTENATHCSVFFSRFHGFLRDDDVPQVMVSAILLLHKFSGFLQAIEYIACPPGSFFCPTTFQGFLIQTRPCLASPILCMNSLGKDKTRDEHY